MCLPLRVCLFVCLGYCVYFYARALSASFTENQIRVGWGCVRARACVLTLCEKALTREEHDS